MFPHSEQQYDKRIKNDRKRLVSKEFRISDLREISNYCSDKSAEREMT